MSDNMTRRLRTEQDGFTLVELLVALALGSLILTATMTVFVNGLKATTRVTDRVEASQRARLAMDRVTTLLNSQTCVYASDGTSVPIVDGQATQVTFYANLGLVDALPLRYRLWYDAPTQMLYEDRWIPTRNDKGDAVYAAGVSATKVVGTHIVPTAAGAAIFQYQQFNVADGTIDPRPLGTSGTLSSADRLKAVRVNAAFAVQPERSKTLDLTATSVRGTGTVASAEGSDPSKGVNC
jgi:prepilin-type N-terminal cleavage/methylation domain-containing protein